MPSLFWADQLAELVIARSKEEARQPVIRTGQTPSGGKHIGNLNDPLRAFFVWKSIQQQGIDARFVHSSDDRDPLKDVPAKLADLDARWHPSSEFPELKKYFGHPLCRVPDPFGCCTSYADHFANLWFSGLNQLGLHPDRTSNDEYYKQGTFDPYILQLFQNIKIAGEIAHKYQESKSPAYIPFDAICPSCGMLTPVTGFDIPSKTVSFTCGGKSIKLKRSEGCGFSGEAPWKEGKLQWRFEWPAQWAIEHTTLEPFGKDHYEGSWKSGQEIIRRIYGVEPPIPYVYEFFLVSGQKMSASKGNVYIVQDILQILEPEIFLFFYTKRPGKQRDLDLKNIQLIIEDYEKAEAVYFRDQSVLAGMTDHDIQNLRRSYELCWDSPPSTRPLSLPYNFAAMISQTLGPSSPREKILDILHRTSHLSVGASETELVRLINRVHLASNWLRQFAPEEARFSLQQSPTAAAMLPSPQKHALIDLAHELEAEKNEQELSDVFRQLSTNHNIQPKQFFESAYLALLGSPRGPRLGPFILAAGRDRVRAVLLQLEK